MKMALELAERGRGWTSPNPMVGAVIVKDGNISGQGFHQTAGGPHAEIVALEQAGEHANGATLYVTLEPCNHTGRTPPCTEAILKGGISRVVAGMKDSNPRVQGGGLDFLQRRGLEVTVGVCEAECRRLNEIFIKYVATSLPFVILKCAATLDGRIATRTGDSKWITNAHSRQFVHELRHAVDAVMVGIGTVLKDNPRLTTRLEDRKCSDPTRIVLDTHLSIPLDTKLLHLSSDSDTLIVSGRETSDSAKKKQALEKAGVRVLSVEHQDNLIDLGALVRELGKLEITSLLIEGGSRINGSALRAQIVDKVHMFYAPKICGGDDGVPICSGPGVELMEQSMRLKNISIQTFKDDVMIEGYFDKQGTKDSTPT